MDDKLDQLKEVLTKFIKKDGVEVSEEAITQLAIKAMSVLENQEKNTQRMAFDIPFPDEMQVTLTREQMEELASLLAEKIIIPAIPDKFEVTNPPVIPDKFEISNLDDFATPEFPEKITISKIESTTDVLVTNPTVMPDIFPVDLTPYLKSNKPIAVRLSDGKFWQDLKDLVSVNVAAGGGGGVGEIIPKEIDNGRLTTTSGTAVPLTTEQIFCRTVSVQSHPDNAGYLYIGDDDVTPANGTVLQPGESKDIDIDQIGRIYISADFNGEQVNWLRVR